MPPEEIIKKSQANLGKWQSSAKARAFLLFFQRILHLRDVFFFSRAGKLYGSKALSYPSERRGIIIASFWTISIYLQHLLLLSIFAMWDHVGLLIQVILQLLAPHAGIHETSALHRALSPELCFFGIKLALKLSHPPKEPKPQATVTTDLNDESMTYRHMPSHSQEATPLVQSL